MDRTKRNRRTMLVGAVAVAGAALAVAGCGSSHRRLAATSSSTGASSTGQRQQLRRASRTTPGATNSKLCTYISKGSGGGITDFTNGVVDWGATDSPLKPSELATLAKTRGGVTPIYFPTFLGAIGVPTNVTGAKTLAVLGQRRWPTSSTARHHLERPEIAADNPGVTLPSATITVCVRADSSGTSSNFSGYLGKSSAHVPAEGRRRLQDAALDRPAPHRLAQEPGRAAVRQGQLELDRLRRHGRCDRAPATRACSPRSRRRAARTSRRPSPRSDRGGHHRQGQPADRPDDAPEEPAQLDRRGRVPDHDHDVRARLQQLPAGRR